MLQTGLLKIGEPDKKGRGGILSTIREGLDQVRKSKLEPHSCELVNDRLVCVGKKVKRDEEGKLMTDSQGQWLVEGSAGDAALAPRVGSCGTTRGGALSGI